MVEWLFLAVQRGCLRFVIVVFPDHTHLLFLKTYLKLSGLGPDVVSVVTVGFLLLWVSVVYSIEVFSLFYFLFISRIILTRR